MNKITLAFLITFTFLIRTGVHAQDSTSASNVQSIQKSAPAQSVSSSEPYVLITILTPVGSTKGLVQVTNAAIWKSANEVLAPLSTPEDVAIKIGEAALKARLKYEVFHNTIKLYGRHNSVYTKDVSIKTEDFPAGVNTQNSTSISVHSNVDAYALITVLSPVGRTRGFVQVANATTGKRATEILIPHSTPEEVAIKIGHVALNAGVKYEISGNTIKIYGMYNTLYTEDVLIKFEDFSTHPTTQSSTATPSVSTTEPYALITVLSPVGPTRGFIQVTNAATGKRATEVLRPHSTPEEVAIQIGNVALYAGVKCEVSGNKIKMYGKYNTIFTEDVLTKIEQF